MVQYHVQIATSGGCGCCGAGGGEGSGNATSSARGIVTTPGPTVVVVVFAAGAVALVSGGCDWGGSIVVGTAAPALCNVHTVATELVGVLWLSVVMVVLITVILVLIMVVILIIVGCAGAGLTTDPIVGFVSFSHLDLPGFRAGGDHVSMADAGGFGNGVGGGCGGHGSCAFFFFLSFFWGGGWLCHSPRE